MDKIWNRRIDGDDKSNRLIYFSVTGIQSAADRRAHVIFRDPDPVWVAAFKNCKAIAFGYVASFA